VKSAKKPARTLKVLWAAVTKFRADDGFFHSAAIAFSVLLSLIPLALIFLALAGSYLYSDAEVAQHLSNYFSTLVPALDPKIMSNLMSVMQTRKTAGLLGILGLLWTASMIFSSLRVSLNTIFQSPKKRGHLHGMAVDFLMILVSGSMLLISMLLTSTFGVLQHYPHLFPLGLGLVLGFLLQYLAPLAFTCGMGVVIYLMVPDRKISIRSAFLGALFVSLFWEIAKQVFTAYILLWGGNYSLVYGPLSALAIFFVWIYYSSAIFLLGAQIAFGLEQKK